MKVFITLLKKPSALQEKNAYRVREAGDFKKTGKRPEDIKIPGKKIEEWEAAGTAKIKRLLLTKNIDEIDPIKKKASDEITGKPTNSAVRRIEEDAVAVQTSVLQRKN